MITMTMTQSYRNPVAQVVIAVVLLAFIMYLGFSRTHDGR